MGDKLSLTLLFFLHPVNRGHTIETAIAEIAATISATVVPCIYSIIYHLSDIKTSTCGGGDASRPIYTAMTVTNCTFTHGRKKTRRPIPGRSCKFSVHAIARYYRTKLLTVTRSICSEGITVYSMRVHFFASVYPTSDKAHGQIRDILATMLMSRSSKHMRPRKRQQQ